MPNPILLPLNKGSVLENAAEFQGVYTLYNQKREIIYHGKAQKQTLQERLLQHIQSSSECLDNACYFTSESARNPDKRLQQLLRKYSARHGRLPECNERLEKMATQPVEQICATGVLTNAFLR